MINLDRLHFDRQKIVAWLPVLGSTLFLVFSLISVVILFNQTQDARRQADVVTKVAEIQINPSEVVFRPNTSVSFDILVDTKGTVTDGVQVVFDVTGVSASSLTFSPASTTGLKKVWEKVEPITNGKRIHLAMVPSDVTTQFSTNGPKRIATVFLNPASEGTISITFNQAWSKINQTKTTNDVLKDTPQKIFTVAVAPTPTPTPRPTSTPAPTAQPTATPNPGVGGGQVTGKTSSLSNDHLQCQFTEFEAVFDLKENNQPVGNAPVKFSFQGQTRETTTNSGGRAKATFSRSQSGTVRAEASGFPTQEMYIQAPSCPTPTPVPTPRPTTRPTSNSSSSYRQPTPRPTILPTVTPRATATVRPTATPRSVSATVTINGSPQPTTSPVPGKGGVGSGGLACNQKCQSTTQCGKDLMCYQGSCRLIDNTESSICQPKESTGSKICDQNCNLNADCGEGLSCLQGKCRLSTNPYSTTCTQPTAADKSTVSGNCNQSCQTNSDCGVLLDCYKSQCRLPSNPKQAQCLTKEEAERSGLSDEEDATTSAVATASVSPSPQPTASASPDAQPSLVSRVLRWILILGGIVVLVVGALLGYAWYQDRKVRVQ